jgi:hypothetical protein
MKKLVLKITVAVAILAGAAGIVSTQDAHSADPGGGGRPTTPTIAVPDEI